MKIRISSLILLFIFSLIFLFSCQPEKEETATKGKLKCYVDESFYPLMTEIRDSFAVKYPDAKIELQKLKAREGIVKVLNGEATMFIGSRGLNDEEDGFLTKSKADVKIIKICYDAITIISDTNQTIDKISTETLKQLLTGKSKQYKVYLPDQNCGIFENVKNSLLDNNKPTSAFIVSSEEDVVKKVLKDKNALGIVGLNMAKTHHGLKILRVGTDEKSAFGNYYYEPVAGYLANGDYPLRRTCYVFLNEIGILVGSGFSTFIASHEGQKIILKNDLGPATVPIKYKQIMRLR